jgi:Sulfotransferase domain
MYTYLSEHPDIFMSPIKEPNFFAEYLGERRRIRTWAEYLSCFAGAKDEKRVGEASVFYMASHTAARTIKEFSPNAHIIIMLRNPIDVMYSMFHLRRFANLEDETTFEAALQADACGRSAPELTYRERVCFLPQVMRYLSTFEREKIHLIMYEDFKADTKGVFQGTLRFLGVNSNIEREFPIINANQRARSKIIWRILRRPPAQLRRIVHPITTRTFRRSVGGYVFHLNAIQEARPPMDQELRVRLQTELAPEIDGLGSLLGKDLTSWYRG